jgi:hypothetical protein
VLLAGGSARSHRATAARAPRQLVQTVVATDIGDAVDAPELDIDIAETARDKITGRFQEEFSDTDSPPW